MKLYSQADFDQNRNEKKRAIGRALLCAAPFAALGVVAFALRREALSIVGFVLAGALLIFLYDLRIRPALCYGRFLAEAHSGLSRETVGMLVRVGVDPVFQDAVNFYEVILNIYEDLSPEGERRFLLDCKKEIPAEWVGRDVVVLSHGNFLLGIRTAQMECDANMKNS